MEKYGSAGQMKIWRMALHTGYLWLQEHALNT
jgi:hypothetical protein